jgi:hypothetical protein
MASPDVALLTFNRNDPIRTLELLDRVADHVREAVVVDSSDPTPWRKLERGLRPPSRRALRAIPTGYADLLQPVGVDEATAEWVFYCDPDEEPSPGLLRRLTDLDGADAYVVPRWEESLGAYTPHLRLFRRSAFVAPDPAYAFPGIRGKVGKLSRGERLVHHRDYRSAVYGDYRTGMMDLESFERPMDRTWVWGALAGAGRSPTASRSPVSPEAASEVAVTLVSLRLAATELLRTGSLAYSAFQWAYQLERARFYWALPPEERRRRAQITRAARAAGGLIRYLGFDRPEYVRSLSEGFTWDVDGLTVLHRLIDFRFSEGTPMPSWPPPTPAG